MSEIERDRALRLAPGCRLSAAEGQEDVLLMPESAMRLNGPARAILALCDGARTLEGIVDELKRMYPTADAARIETDTIDLIGQLCDRGVLEYA